MWTWEFLQIMSLRPLARRQSYEFRKAMRGPADLDLLTIEPGPRGGMSRAKFEWTERAYSSLR